MILGQDKGILISFKQLYLPTKSILTGNKMNKIDLTILKKFGQLMLIVIALDLTIINQLEAEPFYLYFGTYKSKQRANKLESSPTLHSNPFSSLSKCELAGEKIINKIYKPIKFYDGKWTCVEG